jgi:hypothetical protein
MLTANLLGHHNVQVHCNVYARTGVRLGHILQVSQRMGESDLRYVNIHRSSSAEERSGGEDVVGGSTITDIQ